MATTSHAARGLTTTRAAFIEEAKSRGELFIHQPYELYSEENQQTWRRLYAAIAPKWRTYAHPRFLQGVDALALNPERIPRLEEINRFLEPLSAFKAKAVSGYVPAFLFFDSLRRREFPTTITIRDGSRLDYLPEPDIFHDLAGHVPMHTDRRFADALVRFGEVARTAAREVRGIDDAERRLHAVESVIKALARFFWFTVEFGLMERPDTSSHGSGLCVIGSGLLSSAGEIEHAIESTEVQRYPFQLEWVVNQYFEIDKYQPLLFYTRSFEDLFERVDELERWIRAGRLYNVSPGEPEINEHDLASFLEAAD
jgi:phenylalanine-4-hydroxylase